MTEERLQKILAARGVTSRRAAEALIADGRVAVNGRVVTELGSKVDSESDTIKVDGRLVRQPRPIYLLLNKPRGYVTTASDPEGRRTVFDLIDVKERTFAVGRLDMDSEGLLLLTNDGELANRIAHPRYRIDKEYHALVTGHPTPQSLDYLRRGGLHVAGGRTSAAEVTVLRHEGSATWLRVVIHEGRKRQVRLMLGQVGAPVVRLRRVRLGPLTLAGLAPAEYRALTPAEVTRLRRILGLAAETEAAVAVDVAPRAPRTARAARSVIGASRPGHAAARERSTGRVTSGSARAKYAPRGTGERQDERGTSGRRGPVRHNGATPGGRPQRPRRPPARHSH